MKLNNEKKCEAWRCSAFTCADYNESRQECQENTCSTCDAGATCEVCIYCIEGYCLDAQKNITVQKCLGE